VLAAELDARLHTTTPDPSSIEEEGRVALRPLPLSSRP